MNVSWPQCYEYSHPSWMLYMVLKTEQSKQVPPDTCSAQDGLSISPLAPVTLQSVLVGEDLSSHHAVSSSIYTLAVYTR